MYKIQQNRKSRVFRNTCVEGETIEQKIERILHNNEPIGQGAPLMYQDRKDGVNPAYDIRTDRFEIACEAMDKVVANKITKREERMNPKKEEEKVVENSQNSNQSNVNEPA